MTMIELVLAIVIIGVGLAGVMTAFTTVVKGSADPLVYKQMLAIAEEMMEEVALQPFTAVAPAQANSPGACASRAAFNDIMDYQNLKTTGGICDIDGTALPNLSSYNVEVNVNQAATLNTQSGSGNLGGGRVYRITVTVTRGADQMRLVGWRVGYAVGLPD